MAADNGDSAVVDAQQNAPSPAATRVPAIRTCSVMMKCNDCVRQMSSAVSKLTSKFRDLFGITVPYFYL